MNSSPEIPTDLAELLGLYCSGEADQIRLERLQELVAADEQALAYYLGYMQIHGGLEWAFRHHYVECNETTPGVGTAVDAAEPTLAEPTQDPLPRPAPIAHLGWLTGALPARLLGLSLVLVLGGYFVVVMALIPLARWASSVRLAVPAGANQSSGARIIADDHVHRPGRSPTTQLPNGASLLESGTVEIEFDGGARVWVEGPAEFMPQSGRRMNLSRGCLVAYVPRQARGFTVGTPTAELVDLGTEFGVEVDTVGKTDVHVLQGMIEVKSLKPGSAAEHQSQRITAGQAVRISADGRQAASIRHDGGRFTKMRARIALADQGNPTQPDLNPFLHGEPIRLGNLFDDHPHVPLADAMRTDTFGAGADATDLGVDRVIAGGDAVQEIAPHISFDFTNVGWESYGLPYVVNDAWRLDGNLDSSAGIRVSGTSLDTEGRLEDGICQTGNTFVTFQLDDLRAAGHLQGKGFNFVCERAGLNDHWVSQKATSMHMVVIVSTATGVREAFLNGAQVAVVERDGRWSVDSPVGEPLRYNGPIVSFHVSIALTDRYLTLVSTTAGDGPGGDQPAWIDARLEVRP